MAPVLTSSTGPGSGDGEAIAALVSGGLDSCVMLDLLCREWPSVVPVFVRYGLQWEDTELRYLQRFLAEVRPEACQTLEVIHLPMDDVYGGQHWSVRGSDVPDANSEDGAVFLPGRNLILLAKTAVFCYLNGIGHAALGTLNGNPFPDASEDYMSHLGRVAGLGMAFDFRIHQPLKRLTKHQVVEMGAHLPLEHTFSCLRPVDSIHCGRCNKCAERMRAFEAAGVHDPTRYAGQLEQ